MIKDNYNRKRISLGNKKFVKQCRLSTKLSIVFVVFSKATAATIFFYYNNCVILQS